MAHHIRRSHWVFIVLCLLCVALVFLTAFSLLAVSLWNTVRFKEKLYLHLCEVTDGPCIYDGDSMIDIHTGMNIREGDFNHLVELMIKAMDSSAIAYPLQNELLSRLVPLRKEIIKI